MSTAYKYALMQIFCIPTIEEKDTEYQTHEVVPKKQYQNDDRPWFNYSNYDLIVDSLADGEVFSKSALKTDYKISKDMQTKIANLITQYPSQFIA